MICIEDVPDVQSVHGGLTANSARNKGAVYFPDRCWSCSMANVKNMNSKW
jgi:hypothetical protein